MLFGPWIGREVLSFDRYHYPKLYCLHYQYVVFLGYYFCLMIRASWDIIFTFFLLRVHQSIDPCIESPFVITTCVCWSLTNFVLRFKVLCRSLNSNLHCHLNISIFGQVAIKPQNLNHTKFYRTVLYFCRLWTNAMHFSAIL